MYLYDENDEDNQLTKFFDDHFGKIVAVDCLQQGNDYVVVSMNISRYAYPQLLAI